MAERKFSLRLYLLIVFGLSWPFQIIAAIWGAELLPRYILHAGSMFMVTVGTFIAGRYIFKDGFAGAGFNWGRWRHYLAVIILVVILFIIPTIIELLTGLAELPELLTGTEIVWVLVMMLNFIPAFGEEFGWRGYMLPRLARRYSPRKAVLIHSIIWWAWHLPVLVGIGVHAGLMSTEEMNMSPLAAVSVVVALVIVIGAAPAILHGVVFAYLWVWSGSLAVVTFYHLIYDGVRDSIQVTIGGGTVSGIFVTILLSAFGIMLLLKGDWSSLKNSGDNQAGEISAE